MSTPDSRGEGRGSRSAPTLPAASAFGLRSTSKIRDLHLNRVAMVYVRQSSPQQVLENRESRERQYALAEFAQRLGWPTERSGFGPPGRAARRLARAHASVAAV